MISCGHEIDVDKYRTYALDKAQHFVRKYPWYAMPPTIHKILIHGPEIIRHALVPIGQLSEEAQEARNKEFKKYREGFSRKVSRTKTNEDVLNMYLISLDPFISSLKKIPKKRATQFDKEVLDMLRAPDVRSVVDDSSDDTDSVNGLEESP